MIPFFREAVALIFRHNDAEAEDDDRCALNDNE